MSFLILSLSKYSTVEPAIDPNNRITFLLDWELTMKCNLDCDYCGTGLYGGHDNSTKHPPMEQCLSAIDFMFSYVDLYMAHKPKGLKYVVLNVYGGEALHHPNIVEILTQVHEKYKKYQSSWTLTVTVTTNAVIPDRKLRSIIPFVDHFMISYHSTNTDKQKEQFRTNALTIRDSGKKLKCIVMMHTDPDLFKDSQDLLSWCDRHGIERLSKQIDRRNDDFVYTEKQIIWFEKFYESKSFHVKNSVAFKKIDDAYNLSDSGRACCGGRSLCVDTNYKQRVFYTENKFPDWYCSVNEFFLYIKQVTGEIFVNKDCKMSFDGKVEPIGYLNDCDKLLEFTKTHLENNTMPVIQCKKSRCHCGLCAPKASSLEEFNKIMEKYRQ